MLTVKVSPFCTGRSAFYGEKLLNFNLRRVQKISVKLHKIYLA